MKRGMNLLAVASVAVLAGAVSAASAAAQEVKIGVVMSNTGTFAFVGAPVINAIKLAEEELKAKNFFGSTKVTVLYEDNRSDKQEAISLITRMAQRDNAIMVIGPVSTGEAMAAGPVAVDLKVPLFTTATSPEVLKAGPWVFKSTETAEQYMTPLGKHVADKVKPKNCFLVHIRDNEGYIRQKNVFRDVISAGGVKIAADESILAADSDFTALSTKIAASKADCLFLSTPPEQGANITIQAKQAGMPGNTVLVGNTGMGSDKYIKAGGKAVDGTFFVAEFVPSGVNDMSKAFIAAYTKKYGNAPDSWAAVGYSMMLIAANAVKAAGANPTRDAVRAAMAKTKDLPVVVGQGRFTLDAERIPSFGAAVLQVKDGKWVQP
ncbi:MAG: ABC transporter substrate-binding protein [Alphaproteobacteria bacterium]|nr:ABC transporter substrate-binding protein [Alphaproteobacteria bacterium]